MNWLAKRQLDERRDGQSRSERGRVGHVVSMCGGNGIAPSTVVYTREAGRPTGFDLRAWDPPG